MSRQKKRCMSLVSTTKRRGAKAPANVTHGLSGTSVTPSNKQRNLHATPRTHEEPLLVAWDELLQLAYVAAAQLPNRVNHGVLHAGQGLNGGVRLHQRPRPSATKERRTDNGTNVKKRQIDGSEGQAERCVQDRQRAATRSEVQRLGRDGSGCARRNADHIRAPRCKKT